MDDLQTIVDAPDHALRLQPGADRQDHVGLGPQLAAGEADLREIVPVAEGAPAGAVRDHRRLQHLGELAQLRLGAEGAGADEDHGVFGATEELGRLGDERVVGLRRRVGGGAVEELDLGFLGHHVGRHFDLDRPAPAGVQLPERLADARRRLGRMIDALGPFGQAAHQRQLVGNLVEQAESAADRGRGNLAGDRQDRRVAGIGGGKGGRGVQKARAGHDRVNAHAAARLGVAEGHVGGALLVARVDHPDRVALVVKRVEEAVELDARQPEDGVDPVVSKRLDQSLAACHSRHP